MDTDGPGTYGTGHIVPECCTPTTYRLVQVPKGPLAHTGFEAGDLIGAALVFLIFGAAALMARVRRHVIETGEA